MTLSADVQRAALNALGGQKGTVAQVTGDVCAIELEAPLADGVYTAVILVEAIAPISFLLN